MFVLICDSRTRPRHRPLEGVSVRWELGRKNRGKKVEKGTSREGAEGEYKGVNRVKGNRRG